MSWAQAHRQAGVLASELHGALDIDLENPIDVFGVIQRLGIVLAFQPMGNVSGIYLPSAGGAPAGVMIHAGHPRSRQRFTAAHELGHFLYRHDAEIDAGPDPDGDAMFRRTQLDFLPHTEQEAEAFAAWFLMPRRLLRAGIRLHELPMDSPNDAYALSLWLGTSYTATVRQLANVRLIDQAKAETWLRREPKQIKRDLMGGYESGEVRGHDVWQLHGDLGVHPVDVRPGDRLVLDLGESPSTGFTWTPDDLPTDFVMLADSFSQPWSGTEGGGLGGGDRPAPGSALRHSWLLEVGNDADVHVYRLAFQLHRPWEVDSTVDRYERLVSVSRAPQGVQLLEDDLRLVQ